MALQFHLETSWVSGTTGGTVVPIGNETFCYASGKYIFFSQDNDDDDAAKVDQSLRGAGGRHIDKIAFSAKRSLLAYSEVGVNPKVYVHSVAVEGGKSAVSSAAEGPIAVLHGGAKLELRSLQFSESGSRLLMLSGVPDFLLSVWEWESNKCICQTSCSDRPLQAAFSPLSWQKICCRSQNSLVLWKVETCGNRCQFSKRSTQYPMTASGGTLEPLPATYPTPLEPILTKLGEFQPNSLRQPLVELTAFCWSQQGVILTTACGSLLHVACDGDACIDPTRTLHDVFTRDEVPVRLAASNDLLMAACKDGSLHFVRIRGGRFEHLPSTERLPSHATSLHWTPDNKQIAISCATGEIAIMTPGVNSQIVPVADASSSPVVGMHMLWPGTDHVVLCRENGLLEVASIQQGKQVAGVDLAEEIGAATATTMAVSPSLHYLAVGDSTGTVLFVDTKALLNGQKRVFWSMRMHSTAITTLWFDDYGYVMMTSSTDGKLYVCSGAPSSDGVMARIDLPHQLINISSSPFLIDEGAMFLEVYVLLASDPAEESGGGGGGGGARARSKTSSGQLVWKFSLPVATADTTRSALKPFTNEGLQLDFVAFGGQSLTLPEPCTSVCATRTANGQHNLVGTSADRRAMLLMSTSAGTGPAAGGPSASDGTSEGRSGDRARSRGAQPTPTPTSVSTSNLQLLSVLSGPQLPGGHLQRSLRGDGLLCFGPDGQVAYGIVEDWTLHDSAAFHSHRSQGCKLACLSWDGKDVVTAGGDGVVACTTLQPTTPEIRRLSADLVGHCRQAKTLMNDLQDSHASMIQEYPAVDAASMDQVQNGPTWSEKRVEEVNKETERQFSAERNALLADVCKLRDKLMALIAENGEKPDLEQLDRGEFNLDVEESSRLMEEGNRNAQQVREELDLKNIANEYFSELIREECWDNMEVPGKKLKGFHNNVEVSNFVLPKEDKVFEEEVAYLLQQRDLEIAELKERHKMEADALPDVPASLEDEDLMDDQPKKEAARAEEVGTFSSLEGSIAHTMGGRHIKAYSQLDLCSRSRVYFQLHIIKHSLRKLKQLFNKDFDALLLQKESEVARTQERNARMTKIIHDLELSEKLFEPEMSMDEQPERLLKVEDSEILVKKWISPEEHDRLEEQARLDEARRLAEMGDRPRERALDQMMKGRLEIDPEEELYKDIPAPEFMDTKMVELWTEEDKKTVKDYHAAVAKLEEERAKHKKALESEFKKLQSSIAEAVAAFDEKMQRLHESKIERQTAICQEEMKVTRLTTWLLTEDELCNEEVKMLEKVESLKHSKSELMKVISKVQVDLSKAEEELEHLGMEDKLLERNFKRDFGDREGVYDLLFRAFRRRPKQLRKGAAQMVFAAGAAGNSGGQIAVRTNTPPAASQVKQEMTELDSMDNCPEGVDAPTWTMVVTARRRKMESEKTVRQMNHQIAELSAFLYERKKEEDALILSLVNISHGLAELRRERERFYCNLPLQLLLKQGQVEVVAGAFVTDYRNSVLIDRNVINKFNADIKTLGGAKVSTMLTGIEGKKGIYVLEWEHRKMRMEVEDLDRQIQVVNGLRVTKELQKHFVADNVLGSQHDRIERMEAALARTEKLNRHDLGRMQKVLWNVKQKTATREQENLEVDDEINRRFGSVMDRMHLESTFETEDRGKKRQQKLRMDDLVRRSRAVGQAKQQAEQIASLRAELDRWRMKMFPTLPNRPYP